MKRMATYNALAPRWRRVFDQVAGLIAFSLLAAAALVVCYVLATH